MKAGENLKILDFPNLQTIQEFVMTDNEFLSVFSKNGKYFAIGNNKTIDLYEIGTIGVEEMDNNNHKSTKITYPNPTTSELILEFTLLQPNTTTITIHDLSGKQIIEVLNRFLSEGNHKFHIDMSELQTGTYYLRIQSGNEIQTEKISVIK